MKHFFVLTLLLLIATYGLCRNIPPSNFRLRRSPENHAFYVEVENSTIDKNGTDNTQNLLEKPVKQEDCFNNTCTPKQENKIIPTSFEINGMNITLGDLQKRFKNVKISKLRIPIFELENETFGHNIVQDFVKGSQDIKGRVTWIGEIFKGQTSKRSESTFDNGEDKLNTLDIDHLLKTFIDSNQYTIENVYLVFLVYNPEKATNKKTTENEHDILKMEESKLFDFIHGIGINNVRLKEHLMTITSETVSTRTPKNEKFKFKNDKIFPNQQPGTKIKREVAEVQKAKEEQNKLKKVASNNNSSSSSSTSTTTQANASSTMKENGTNTKMEQKQTKPYFLIVTLPTVICWGAFVIFLCYFMRSDGWCCSLFKDVTQDEESSSD